MEDGPEIPTQYAFLFRLMRECSAAYTDQLAELARDAGEKWNARTARFEVDAYFTFLLSLSLLSHNHNRQVWEDMCDLCMDALIVVHRGQLSSKNLSDVLVARIEQYGRINDQVLESGETPFVPWVQALRRHILASAHGGSCEREHPLILEGIVRCFASTFAYLAVDQAAAWVFAGGLNHIFQRSTDIRQLSEEELTTLARAGQVEAAAAAARSPDMMAASRRWVESFR